ncbi:hypothetical protein KM043_008163 [Ampulex compressa]|nr:hypothetical protein KM043_008163 [Ampulex compressa]
MLIYVRAGVAPRDLASSEDPTGHSPVPSRTPYNLHPETLLLPETLKPLRWWRHRHRHRVEGPTTLEGTLRSSRSDHLSATGQTPVRLIAKGPEPKYSTDTPGIPNRLGNSGEFVPDNLWGIPRIIPIRAWPQESTSIKAEKIFLSEKKLARTRKIAWESPMEASGSP